MFKVPEQFRYSGNPKYITISADGNNGPFLIPHPNKKDHKIFVIASDGMGWEHVSVQIMMPKKGMQRTPTWDEMCYIKNIFWDKSDCVVQFHPEEKDYVNVHNYVLHLWRPTDQVLPTPLSIMV